MSYGSLDKLFPYPKSLQDRAFAGQVIVEFDITETGKVANPQIIQSPSIAPDEIVVSGIQFLKFKPGTQNG